MTSTQKWLLNATTIALTVTGAVFAWMKYFLKSDDPFAVANHPWQPYMLDVHVIVAPISLFAIGIVYAVHVKPKREGGARSRRKTGLATLWMIAPMVLSAYLMQVLTAERLVEAMRVVHWLSSVLFAIGLLVHQLVRKAGNGSSTISTADDERGVW